MPQHQMEAAKVLDLWHLILPSVRTCRWLTPANTGLIHLCFTRVIQIRANSCHLRRICCVMVVVVYPTFLPRFNVLRKSLSLLSPINLSLEFGTG